MRPPTKKDTSTLLSFGAEIQRRTLKSSPFELRLSDFDFEKMYGFVRQFSSKWRANSWIPIKIGRCSLIGVVFKVRSHKWLQFDQFLLDFSDLRVILTRIVSQIRTSFWNRNWTIVARTASIIVCIIEVYTVTFEWEGVRCYYNGYQQAALGLIRPSWRHQNRLCSANVVHFARSNRT